MHRQAELIAMSVRIHLGRIPAFSDERIVRGDRAVVA
jgi:hypothetical protein